MKKLSLLSTTLFCSLLLAASPSIAKETSVADYFPDKLVDANGKKVSRDSLKGKFVGIYFSAHWCPPCRQFTPLLVKFRDQHKKDFEVVFISSDHSLAKKKSYMKEEKMKWPTLKGLKSKEATAYAEKFQVQGIPALIIITPDGSPLTPNGRAHVSSNPEGAIKMWKEAIKKGKS